MGGNVLKAIIRSTVRTYTSLSLDFLNGSKVLISASICFRYWCYEDWQKENFLNWIFPDYHNKVFITLEILTPNITIKGYYNNMIIFSHRFQVLSILPSFKVSSMLWRQSKISAPRTWLTLDRKSWAVVFRKISFLLWYNTIRRWGKT